MLGSCERFSIGWRERMFSKVWVDLFLSLHQNLQSIKSCIAWNSPFFQCFEIGKFSRWMIIPTLLFRQMKFRFHLRKIFVWEMDDPQRSIVLTSIIKVNSQQTDVINLFHQVGFQKFFCFLMEIMIRIWTYDWRN